MTFYHFQRRNLTIPNHTSIKIHENNNNDNISNLSEFGNLDCCIVFACSNPVHGGGASGQIQVGEKARTNVG